MHTNGGGGGGGGWIKWRIDGRLEVLVGREEELDTFSFAWECVAVRGLLSLCFLGGGEIRGR
jgi:hypothetical protein